MEWRKGATATAVVAVLAVMLAACGANAPDKAMSSDSLTVTDLAGRTVAFDEYPKTVVAAGAGALRMVTYLGLADSVVGVEDLEHKPTITRPYAQVNAGRFAQLPVIGQGGAGGSVPNVESVLSVQPDVIVAKWKKPMADDIESKTGIPVLVVGYDSVFDERLYTSLELIGTVLQKKERADRIVAKIKEVEADLDRRTTDIAESDQRTVYTGGVNFRGKHGFAGTYAQYPPFVAIHAKNIVDRTGRSGGFQVDLEEVIQRDPDIIFLNPENLAMIKADRQARPGVFASLSAVRDGRVFSQITFVNYTINIEIALADAYYAGAAVYPDRFSDVDPATMFDDITREFLGTPLYEAFASSGLGFTKISLD